MRPELEQLADFEEAVQGKGWDDYIRSFIALNPTAAERQRWCEVLQAEEDPLRACMLTGMMEMDPRPEYHEALKKALGKENLEIVADAARSLLAGGYPDALEIVFSNERVQQALGDDLPFQLGGCGNEALGLGGPWRQMTGPMREKLLALFCERFGKETPRLNAMTAPWFRLLAQLRVSNARVVEILVRIWGELHPRDTQNQYLLLKTMAACPHPSFEPIFKKAVKSRIEDLRDEAELGMKALRGE